MAVIKPVRDIAEDEEFEKAKAMIRLMCELNEGRRSGEEDGYGYVSSEEVMEYFRGKRPWPTDYYSMLVDRVLFGKSDYMRTLRFAVED